METRHLKVIAHHATGIKNIKVHLGRMSPYVTIGVVGHKFHPKPQKTNPHIHGHTDPVWESQMVVQLPQDALNEGNLYNLVVEIKHHSRLSDRLIGKVTIPLRDVVLVNRERVSYLVMTSGDAHGKLVLSHSLVAAAGAGEDDVHVAVGTPVPTPVPPAQAPIPPAQAPLPPEPTTNPLVAMGLAAGATAVGDNLVNTGINLTDFFG